MIVASTIKNYGMSSNYDLMDYITTLIEDRQITQVIETGTYMGLGTTKAVIDGMLKHGMDYQFITMEVNPNYYHQAVNNNVGTQTEFWNGLSIPKSMLPTSVTFNVPDFVVVDHHENERERNYTQEVSFNVEDDLLAKACKIRPEMVILDSAGHIGFIEFKYLMSLLPDHDFILVLDDIHHVKHYDSFQYVKSRPDKFTIIWQSDDSEMHRSAIIKVNGDVML